MRAINLILVHCAATYPHMDIGVKEIREWHMRDNGWTDIGYHYVICRDGRLETGRPLEQAGAHCQGKNADSIGVCLAGGLEKTADGKDRSCANYTEAQYATLRRVLHELTARFAGADVRGHQDFANKACPCFNVAAWWKENSHVG